MPSTVIKINTGWPNRLYIFQHTKSLEPFKKRLNEFHQSVPRISGNKDKVVVFTYIAVKYSL